MSERRYAVLIANSEFPLEPNLRKLRLPENDVDGLNEVFSSKELGDFTDISVLKNESSYDVQKKILAVLKQADKSDLVLIYYSGHGKPSEAAGLLHLATKDTVLSVLEATSIPVANIRNFVDASLCDRVALILDCCYSGAAGKAFARGDVDEQLRQVSLGRGTYVITASTALQEAKEMETDQFGLLTKYIIRGIQTGEADRDQDGNVSMDELYRYVHDRVLEEGPQEPTSFNSGVRGTIFIARAGKPASEARRRAIRDRITRLANEDLLPDDIVTKAWAVVHETSSEASDSSRRYRELLERLEQGRLRTKDFIGEWYKVAPRYLTSEEEGWRNQEELRRKQEQEEERSKEQEALRLEQQLEDQRKQEEQRRKQEEEKRKEQEALKLKQQLEEDQRKQEDLRRKQEEDKRKEQEALRLKQRKRQANHILAAAEVLC